MSPKEYAARIEGQKQFLREVADRIEAGLSLKEWHHERWPLPYNATGLVASILRDVADKMPTKQKKARGHQPEFNRATARILYGNRRARGENDTQALAWLAQNADVTVEAIKRAVGTTRKERDELAKGIHFVRKT